MVGRLTGSAGDAVIRPAELTDVPALLELEEAVFPGDRLNRHEFRGAIRSPTILTLVAVTGSRLDGYVFVELRRRSKSARMSSLAVASAASGRGIGRRLLEAAEAGAAGRRRMRLEVRADNARAMAIYEAAGYRAYDTVEDYYDDGETAICYEKVFPALDGISGPFAARRASSAG